MPTSISPSASIVLKPGTHFAECVLMPGDPLRAKYIAEHYLENPVLVNDVRNMLAYTGTYEGKEVSVMGSGMGVPSLGLYVHELFAFFGVKAVIRVGSAGGLGDDIRLRDVVIAMSASTNSSFVSAYDVHGIVAPTADYEMLKNRYGLRLERFSAMEADRIEEEEDKKDAPPELKEGEIFQ